MKLSDSTTISTGCSPQGWVLLSVQQLHLRSLICQTPVVWEPHYSHLGVRGVGDWPSADHLKEEQLRAQGSKDSGGPPASIAPYMTPQWTQNISSLIKKALQRMCFLYQLKKLYTTILSFITIEYAAATAKDKGSVSFDLLREWLLSSGPAHLHDPEACMKDCRNTLLETLLSEKSLRSIWTKNSCYKKCFFPSGANHHCTPLSFHH